MLHKIVRSYEFTSYFVEHCLSAKDGFNMPFIENLNGQTALHLSLDEKTQNTRVAEFFLRDLLSDMPLDHHGRAIADVIPDCINNNIAYIGEYLDSRFVTTRQLNKVSRTDKKKIKVCEETEDEKYFIAACDLWPDERLLK